MTWQELLANNTVARTRATKSELENLRSIVARSLRDVTSPGLSADLRFVLAYDAARTLSLMIVRAAGYRPRKVGGHQNTFLALETADPAFSLSSAYFDGCRVKRNTTEYDLAGAITDTEADALLNAVQRFAVDVEDWIRAHHPEFAAA
ncbi:MAG: hypothetical protein KGL45_11090 [Gammaproteobacteria bacterium]|nr:hypothetical protein [Gammaproteobacteria bacterium]